MWLPKTVERVTKGTVSLDFEGLGQGDGGEVLCMKYDTLAGLRKF